MVGLVYGSRARGTLHSLVLLLVALDATSARADALPHALVLRPRTAQADADAGVNRDVLDALKDLAVLELLPQPPLDLEAAQLAIDCMGESVRCLREVAKRAEAEVLIAPSVERKAGTIELRILYFDAESGAEPRSVVRKQPGDQIEPQTLAAIPDMLRELLRIEKSDTAQDASATDAAAQSPAASEPGQAKRAQALPLAPLVLGAAGVLTIAGGITLGIVMKDTQHSYASRMIQSMADAAAADAERKQGQREAVIANVLIGVGGAAVLASAIWLAAGLVKEHEAQRASLVPMLGSDRAGLVLTGALEARRQ